MKIASYKNLLVWQKSIELETHIIIAKKLFINKNLNYSKVDELLSEAMRMLNKLSFSLVN